MSTVKGILFFNDLFVAKAIKGTPGAVAKFGATILFPPGDPELARITAEFNTVVLQTYPSLGGQMPAGTRPCLQNYRDKYLGKDYYNPELDAWMVLTTTAQASDAPHVVDAACQPIMNQGDAGLVRGSLVNINYSMSSYTEGTGGVGGWLNGIMTTGEMGQLGRIDNKQSAQQMFQGAAPAAATPAAPAAVGTASPVPPATATPSPPAAVGPIMTEKATAAGQTYEMLIAANWTDELLVQHGYMIQPSFS